MQELREKIKALLAASPDGRVLYQDVLDSLSYEERQVFVRVLELAKVFGEFKRKVVWDKENKQNVLYIESMV